VVGLVILVGAFHTFLARGDRLYRWLLDHAPLARPASERFAAAFAETGRGLLIGVGGTALLQGAVATIGYVVIGVPQPFVLGLLTVFASLIPSVGSGLVWAPVAAGLALGGRMGAATAMVAIGVFVSVVDNLVRPWLSRYGKLELPGFLLFVSMLGGIAAFGGVGLFIGPLFVRLAVEGLSMWRERDHGRLAG
jgi:predicted PurR-regulated permease PerM